ncbi:unnamed protein product [Diplocarpon coronariae]
MRKEIGSGPQGAHVKCTHVFLAGGTQAKYRLHRLANHLHHRLSPEKAGTMEQQRRGIGVAVAIASFGIHVILSRSRPRQR